MERAAAGRDDRLFDLRQHLLCSADSPHTENPSIGTSADEKALSLNFRCLSKEIPLSEFRTLLREESLCVQPRS